MHARGERAGIYLWLGATDALSALPLAGRLEFAVGTAPMEATLAALQTFLRQFPLWTIALDTFRADAPPDTTCHSTLVDLLARLPSLARLLSTALTALAPRPGVVVDADRARTLGDSLLMRAAAASRALLDGLIEISWRFGTMHSGGWEGSCERLDPMGPLEPCACGQATVYGQRSRFMGADDLLRAEYQCARCGAVGEDDARRLLVLTEAPDHALVGGTLRVTCRLRAPARERAQISVTLLIESLYEPRGTVAGALEGVVEAGREITFDLEVQVSASQRSGVHPVAVIAVVNGAPCLCRQMIDFRPAGRTDG